jgi:cytochrome c oxidase subunit 4
MTTPHSTHSPQRIDPEGLTLDPHGEHGEHHGHVIVSFWTLTAVLATLLFFTVLTVACSRGEIWAAETFDLAIPQWVNISIALSIATVKSILVVLFFMQLKYDNKVNAIMLSACIFCISLFLGFSMIDLGNRGTIYAFKAEPIERGGTGVMLYKRVLDPATGEPVRDAEGKPVRESVTGSIVSFAANRYIAAHGLEAWETRRAFIKHVSEPDAEVSDANRARPRTGLTPGLFDESEAPPAGGGH